MFSNVFYKNALNAAKFGVNLITFIQLQAIKRIAPSMTSLFILELTLEIG